ncbi:tryptophan--tRNA ligase, partial [bacterium]|nr:tryptophan--tRNA ligase [bacterium]
IKDPDELRKIRETCESGERGCGQCKIELADSCNDNLRPVRRKREELAQNPKEVEKILKDGASKARVIAGKVLKKTLKAVGIK